MADCSLLNPSGCIESFFEFLKNIINAPFTPLLDLIQNLLSSPVNLSLFDSLWVLIIYILSVFYGLFILWAGFNFIISGYDSGKREEAKSWLKNVLVMIVLVQASYLLYESALEISARLTSGILGMIDPDFFLLTVDSLVNLGLEIMLGIVYLFTLIITVIFLALRYFLVAVGLVFFPIGIFFYFIPFLKAYGKLVISSLMVIIFLPFFQSMILLIVSKMMEAPVFADYKIVVMIVSFFLINLLMVFLLVFALIKSAFAIMNSDVGKATKIAYGRIK